MNDFDRKWQELAARARQAAPREETAPYGFESRVRALAREGGGSSTVEIWGWLTLRFLGAAVPVLLICAAVEAPHLRGARALEPGVQNTVAQILWRL